MRTKFSVCARKRDFASAAEASAAIRDEAALRPYRCDRCARFHLTSRTRGKRIPRPASA